MKNAKFTPTMLGLLLGTALAAAPLIARASSAPGEVPAVSADEAKAAKTFSGKVEAKSDTSLTVGGHTVKLTSATRFTKAGAPAACEDAKLGVQVNVTTSDDGETATAVDIAGE